MVSVSIRDIRHWATRTCKRCHEERDASYFPSKDRRYLFLCYPCIRIDCNGCSLKKEPVPGPLCRSCTGPRSYLTRRKKHAKATDKEYCGACDTFDPPSGFFETNPAVCKRCCEEGVRTRRSSLRINNVGNKQPRQVKVPKIPRAVPLNLRSDRSHMERAKRLGLPWEKISMVEVFEADGWVCGVCRHFVDHKVMWPHKRSPSLDHVVPLSNKDSPGHVRSNVQLTHLECNMRKGSR